LRADHLHRQPRRGDRVAVVDAAHRRSGEDCRCLFRARVRAGERRLRVGAHAGVEPEKGRSAIVAGADLVRGIHALNGKWPAVTANVSVFKAGTRPNIVCDQAELQVDIRAMAAGPLRSAIDAVVELATSPVVPDVTVDVETMHS